MGGQNFWGILYRYKEVMVLIILIVLTYVYFGQHSNGPIQGIKVDPFDEIRLTEKHLFDLAPDDSRLIKYVRYRYLTPPSDQEYNLRNPDEENELSTLILKLFNNKRNGVFIESGARDGDGDKSSTLRLEIDFGWTGILVECNPTIVPYLKSKHRKAFVAGVCLSTSDSPAKFKFSHLNVESTNFEVESVPLYTILEASGFNDIDFWSLDVEGSEIEILKSFPFDKIKIKVIIMEKRFFTKKELSNLDMFMMDKGFIVYKHYDLAFQQTYLHTTFASKLQPQDKGWFD